MFCLYFDRIIKCVFIVRCKVGWWGSNCELCYPYPGCVNGNCSRPWECNCSPGWGGMFCDQGIHCYYIANVLVKKVYALIMTNKKIH